MKHFQPARVGADKVEIHTAYEGQLSAADAVAFTKNDKQHGINNNDHATVLSVDSESNQAQVQTKDGREITVDLDNSQHRYIRHDYATTAFSAQGKTADWVFAHAESRRENLINEKALYVITSRAKYSAHIYTDDQIALTSAIRQRSREQSAALDQTQEQQQARQQWWQELAQGRQPQRMQSRGMER